MQLYGLKTCDSCRKAMKALPQAELVDVRSDGVPDRVLTAALSQFGDALINTRSTTWRNLTASERELPPIDLLGSHPALMKRPLIVAESGMYLGWSDATRQALCED